MQFKDLLHLKNTSAKQICIHPRLDDYNFLILIWNSLSWPYEWYLNTVYNELYKTTVFTFFINYKCLRFLYKFNSFLIKFSSTYKFTKSSWLKRTSNLLISWNVVDRQIHTACMSILNSKYIVMTCVYFWYYFKSQKAYLFLNISVAYDNWFL